MMNFIALLRVPTRACRSMNRRKAMTSTLLKRHLDCAVINFVHLLREREGLEAFDTLRGVFTGRPPALSRREDPGENTSSDMRSKP